MTDTTETNESPETTGTTTVAAPRVEPNHILSAESKNWAMAGHLSAFVVFIGIPLPVLGPLFVWLMNRDDDAYAEWHAREALNFNISIMLYTIVSALLILLLVGILLLPAVLISWFILAIVGAVRASSGEYYRYPMTIRFVS